MPGEQKLTGTEIVSTEQNYMLSATMSYISSFVSSAFSSTYQYLTTPAPFPPKTMNGRLTTKYSDNVAASLSLPERPKLKSKTCKIYQSNSVRPAAISNLFSFFTWQTKPSEKKDEPLPVPPLKKRKICKNDIDMQMIELVAELSAMKHKDPKLVEDIYLKQIDLVEYEIMEHAQRRVDLYFYLLVAVYKQGANIVKSSTNKQHGVGALIRGTEASHDSFFPHIELQYPQTKLSALWSPFVTYWSLSGTHFEDSNNMTTELPAIVNYFDTFIELAVPGQRSRPSKYLNKLLKDLNLVSRGEKTPIDAMNSFLTTMHLFFNDFEKKLDNLDKSSKEEKSETEEIIDDFSFTEKYDGEEKINDDKKLKFPYSMHRAMRKIYELQKTGTLRAQEDDSHCIDHHYICTLLRVPADQILKTKQDPSLLLNYYCPIIQKEIFTTKSIIGEDKKIIKPPKIS